MNRLLLPFLLIFILNSFLFAQAPQVLAISPVSLFNAAPADGELIIDFDQAVDPSTANSSAIKVFGRWSGPAAGTISLEENDSRIRFTPDDPFIAGEWVTVTLTKGIQAISGVSMAKGYTWNFWIATSPGSLEQTKIDEFSMREPGEGLIQLYGAYAGDLNNDGYSDLTVVSEAADDLRILLNDGAGNYDDFVIYPMGNLAPSPNEGADFNNDGEIDFAVGAAHNSEVRVLMGDGQGSFSSMTIYDTGNGPRGVAALDCNGDGYDDILTTNRISDNMNLLMNNGDGTFVVNDLNPAGNGETSCAIADANNDGIPDVFVAMYSSKEIGILLGDGAGNFTLSDKVSVGGRPWMAAAGDLNGDGNADMVSVNSEGNILVVAFGDGAGGLEPVQTYAPDNYAFPVAIDLGDLDGDGDLDMVSSNYLSGNYTVFENDGSGAFTVVDVLEAPDKGSCAILHDRDNDGDLDITTTDEGIDIIQIFDNPGIVDDVFAPSISSFSFEILPNPASDNFVVKFQLEKKAEVLIELFDLLGQKQKTLYDGELGLGEHNILEEGIVKKLAAGAYILKLTAGDEVGVQKVIIE